ncbi:MAG: chaperone modulator CbpM [Lutibacter sp.]
MNEISYLSVKEICDQYQVEISFFNQLEEIGLINVSAIENVPSIATNSLNHIDKMMRLHHDLELNAPGIEIVLNLLNKVDFLQNEIIELQNKLKIYEDDL